MHAGGCFANEGSADPRLLAVPISHSHCHSQLTNCDLLKFTARRVPRSWAIELFVLAHTTDAHWSPSCFGLNAVVKYSLLFVVFISFRKLTDLPFRTGKASDPIGHREGWI